MSAARLHKRAVKKAVKRSAQKRAAQERRAAKSASSAPASPARAKVRSYRHDHKRVHIPHAGLARNDQSQQQPSITRTLPQADDFDPHLHPQLQWAGRQNSRQQNMTAMPLHVHERVDPAVIIRATLRRNGNGQMPLFEDPEDKLPLQNELQFYRHQKNWSNRLIAGDSMLVMQSLIHKENMTQQVQCIYMDPPYGIKYGSNFQPFVNKREVKDGHDNDLSSEPEMINAFRDTWQLGVHSYLSHLRQRLLLASSGSCFVQISDQNVHLVRCVMDEIFGADDFVDSITYKTTVGMSQKMRRAELRTI